MLYTQALGHPCQTALWQVWSGGVWGGISLAPLPAGER
jgi:hypothetical protein